MRSIYIHIKQNFLIYSKKNCKVKQKYHKRYAGMLVEKALDEAVTVPPLFTKITINSYELG
jgi:hypothetical protein